MSADQKTADAFATSWNNLPKGSTYTYEQFSDWLAPITQNDVNGKTILELGCGNASLLVHLTQWTPLSITGVDLGDSIISANQNMAATGYKNYTIIKDDLVHYNLAEKYDVCYSIGVLHHLKEPKMGLDSVIRNTKQGGKFHCWVYAKEGNALIIYVVDPVRKVVSLLPWWFTKYFVATPLSALYFAYAHIITSLKMCYMPLYEYSKWICKRNYSFFRHVAFDQLVTPQTTYIDKKTIEDWLKNDKIDQSSTYIIFRNGNSWKFGGTIK
jgi:2-polyprenyl-3-methyl-5-hydroxy-6-metoxy-1,4-benzoquinol methylase